MATTEPELIRHWGHKKREFAWLVVTQGYGVVQVASASAHDISWDDYHDFKVPPVMARVVFNEVITVQQDLANGREPSVTATHALDYIGGTTRFVRVKEHAAEPNEQPTLI